MTYSIRNTPRFDISILWHSDDHCRYIFCQKVNTVEINAIEINLARWQQGDRC